MNELRTETERLAFCNKYFQTVDATCAYTSTDYREYVLPAEIDKELTDRPFYWMWAEQTGQPIQHTTLRLAFSDLALERENARLKQAAWIDFEQKQQTAVDRMFFRFPSAELMDTGSFRLEKIFRSINSRGKFACVVPCSNPNHMSLVPWLCVNGVISFCCDSREEQWFSIGICLQNQQIIDGFFEKIKFSHFMTAQPADVLANASTSVIDTLTRAKQRIKQLAMNHPTAWAITAQSRLNQELERLHLYYGSLLHTANDEQHLVLTIEQERKEADLFKLYSPKIIIECKQIALIGLFTK